MEVAQLGYNPRLTPCCFGGRLQVWIHRRLFQFQSGSCLDSGLQNRQIESELKVQQKERVPS